MFYFFKYTGWKVILVWIVKIHHNFSTMKTGGTFCNQNVYFTGNCACSPGTLKALIRRSVTAIGKSG